MYNNQVNSIIYLNNIAKQATSLRGGLTTSVFSSELSDSLNLLQLTFLNETNFSLATQIHKITSQKYDHDNKMRDVLFDFRDEVQMFDIMAEQFYLPIYETLSTPDFKLYYPEPFIASPSFVHEDL